MKLTLNEPQGAERKGIPEKQLDFHLAIDEDDDLVLYADGIPVFFIDHEDGVAGILELTHFQREYLSKRGLHINEENYIGV